MSYLWDPFFIFIFIFTDTSFAYILEYVLSFLDDQVDEECE